MKVGLYDKGADPLLTITITSNRRKTMPSDTERLDYLQEHRDTVVAHYSQIHRSSFDTSSNPITPRGNDVIYYFDGWSHDDGKTMHKTIRAAIDAAMEAESDTSRSQNGHSEDSQ